MPGVIDPETVYVDDLPSVWSPVQEKLSPEQHAEELEEQATASLLWASPVPEQILRILLDETAIQRLFDPPPRYDPEAQGDWDPARIAFGFKRGIKLMKERRTVESLILEYELEGAGYWGMEISQESVFIERL